MKERLIWADNLKGILMILVVLGHAIQYSLVGGECESNRLWNYIYSFHMPAFMAVSGWLSYRVGGGKNRLSIIYRRFLQLLVPYFAWEIIYRMINGNLTGESLFIILTHPYFWFLWVLFFIIVTFQFGDWLSEKIKVKQVFVMICLAFLYTIIMVVCEIRILGFQFIAYYFLFYVVGYYIHKYPKLVVHNIGILTLLVFIWAFLAWFWNMHELPPFMSILPLPGSMLQYAYRFLTGLVAVYVLLCIAPNIMNMACPKMLVELGQISLGIYVVHLLIIPHITKVLGNSIDNVDIVIVTSFIIAFVLSWLIVKLIQKWELTSRFLLGKVA